MPDIQKSSAQLRLVRKNLDNLPGLNLSSDYVLRTIKPHEAEQWEKLCEEAFDGNEQNFENWVRKRKGYVEDGVFVILCGGEMVATGTAICDRENTDNFGYVHMVAASKKHAGNKLGYEVSAAVLRKFKEEGFAGAELTTDDSRIPAIKVYLQLGFEPDYSVDGTMKERWAKVFGLLSKKD